jgi:hypothetical protein
MRRVPSGEKLMELAGPPVIQVVIRSPVAASHTPTVPSRDADPTAVPSGAQHTSYMESS